MNQDDDAELERIVKDLQSLKRIPQPLPVPVVMRLAYISLLIMIHMIFLFYEQSVFWRPSGKSS